MKIKVSADTVLSIIKGIMEDEDINYTIDDPSAPDEWKNKTVQQALNVEYYTFKHRPVDTEVVVREMMGNIPPNSLQALNRSFCILSLASTERVCSKKNDIVTVSANLEYWIQSDKVKLLEDLVEDMTIETTGERIPIQIGTEKRQVLIAFGSLGTSEIQESTEFGEMAVCDFNVDIIFYPIVTSMVDYKFEFKTPIGNSEIWVEVPMSSFAVSFSMNQKPVPFMNSPRNVGSLNLSRVKTIVFTFDGYDNAFVNYLVSESFKSDSQTDVDNNKALALRITRRDAIYLYDCTIKEHCPTVQEDTGNEVHSLTLTTRGYRDGVAQS